MVVYVTPAEKRAQTMERKRNRLQLRRDDYDRALEVLRSVRDDPTADPSARVEAVKLLREIEGV